MLSIGRLGTTGGADYYLDKVANNVDDYYLGRGEAPGQWIGATAEQLGLVGQVDAEALRNLLAGQVRPTVTTWASSSVRRRRPGYDLTFSAPKGVSLLWAFGSDEVRDTISAAHDRAVGAVLDHLSTEACYARRGRDGGASSSKPRASSAPPSGTAPAGPATPSSTPMSSSPTWSRVPTAGGPPPTAATSTLWQKAAGTLYHSALRAELHRSASPGTSGATA